MGFTNVHCWFPKGTLQWQRNLGKSRLKYKEKAAKNCHRDKVQDEKDSKFPLIVEKGRKKMLSTKLDCCSANSEKLQHDSVKDSNRWSSESRKILTFYEKIQMMKLGKFQWTKT